MLTPNTTLFYSQVMIDRFTQRAQAVIEKIQSLSADASAVESIAELLAEQSRADLSLIHEELVNRTCDGSMPDDMNALYLPEVLHVAVEREKNDRIHPDADSGDVDTEVKKLELTVRVTRPLTVDIHQISDIVCESIKIMDIRTSEELSIEDAWIDGSFPLSTDDTMDVMVTFMVDVPKDLDELPEISVVIESHASMVKCEFITGSIDFAV